MGIVKKSILYLIFFFILFISTPFILRSGFIDGGIKFKYAVLAAVYYGLLFAFNKISLIRVNLFLVLSPIILWTIFGLYRNPRDLVPAMFPMINFIFAFTLIPFIFTYKRILWFSLSLILIISSILILYPVLVVDHKADFTEKRFKVSDESSLITSDSINVKIPKDFAILDFMFINCPPCIIKLPYINKLGEKTNNIYVIVNGNIDSFKKFQKFEIEHKGKYSNLTFLYDKGGEFTKELNISKYPHEIIVNNNKIVLEESGVQQDIKKEYVQHRLNFIQKLKNK